VGDRLGQIAVLIGKRSQERRNDAVTVTDGRRVLKVLDAIIKSDHTGEPVRIG
jgi:hypothetical protein